MPHIGNCLKGLPLFLLCAGISLAYGLLVPTVFNWGLQKAARRSYPILERNALGVIVATSVAAILIWLWTNRAQDTCNESKARISLQFGIRQILIAMTLMAVALVAAPFSKPPWLNGFIVVVALIIGIGSFFYEAPVRSRAWSVIAVIFLPFVWMIAYNVPFGPASGLAINLPIAPGVPAAELMRAAVGSERGDAVNVASAALVLVMLGLGAVLARRGGKLAVAYLAFVLTVSGLSSLALHVVYRM